MAFDVEGALAAGYSRADIADYLASQKNFDVAGARNAGYSDEDILAYLMPEKPLAKAAAPKVDTVPNPLNTKEPGLIDKLISSVKEAVTPAPSSVMEGYKPTAEEQQKAADRRLALGQGPVSEAAVAKAQDVRTGRLKTEDEGILRLARTLQEQQAPTLEGVAQRVTEDERIAAELETARRQQIARERPLLSSLESGLAGMTAGGLNVPSMAADAFNQTFVNPVLEAAGLQPLGRVPTAYGTEYLGKAAQDYMPGVGRQGMGEAYDKGQFGQWLFSNMAANSPQIAMSLAAAYFPPLRASLLPAMGGTAAGQSFAGGDDSRVALAKGAVEVVTEMLPLGVFDKVGDVLRGMSPARQKAVLTIAGQRILQSGAQVTADLLTNAIEETAAQFGGNVLDKYFQGKDVELTKDLDEAAVLGAATGGAMAAPRAAGILAGRYEQPTPEQEIAGIISQNVTGMQPVGTELEAVAALSPTPIDPAQLAQRILQSQTVDEAIAAAEQTAGTITPPSYAPSLAPAAATPLPSPTLPAPAFPAPAAPTVAEIQQPAEPIMNLGRIEPTMEALPETGAVTLPPPSAEVERQFGLDLLRIAPRPQRIGGQPVTSLTDDQLRSVVGDESASAISRRGAQIELDARAAEQRGGRVEPTLEPITPAAAPAAEVPAAAAESMAGAAQPATIRADAQSYFDEQAAAEGRESPVQLNPAPAAEQQAVQQIADALESQFGANVQAYSDPRDTAVNGFAYKGVGFVNVANVPMNITRTSLHEFKHIVEQIARAEAEAGLTDTPAQQFVADIDSIFDDISETDRIAYAENFLFADELEGLTGAKRAKRLRQLMASPTLRSEMTADFLGNRATDKAFWQDLAAQDPEGFKGFVEKWLKIIDNLLATLRGKPTQGEKESAKVDKYIRDLNAAKMIARDALIAYRRGTLAGAAPEGKPAMQMREGEGREANIPAGTEGVQPPAERAGQAAGEAGRGEIPSYGEAREGAISVIGRHYSPRVQTSLDSRYYGTGLRGAEGSRLRESKDSRISKRIYFYVDTGKGIRPESGVGRFAHEVRLNNIYDPASRLIPPQGNSNAFESAVIDAGFDGYIAPFGNGAAVVLLGPQHTMVPVKSLEAPAFSKPQKDEEKPEPSKRQYKLELEKQERQIGEAAKLSTEEQGAVLRDAAEFSIPEQQVIELLNQAREIKRQFPESAGWAPLKLIGLEVPETEEGKEPKPELKWQAIAYAFNRPPGTTRAPAKIDEAWAEKVADEFYKLVKDIYNRAAAGDKNAQIIISHQTWYRNVAEILRREYGAQGDLLADLLGATSPNTPVDTNWRFSVEILRRFVRGDFNKELAKFDQYIRDGGKVSKYPAEDKIRQISGKLYGMNSSNAQRALLDMWRIIEAGSAPKARNFALNLIGQSNMATIDVWAARMLRRAANLVKGADLRRIPPPAEQGVTGTWNAKATAVTGEFGFGADVMDKVSEKLKKDGIDVTPPDLQAIAWFAEKELWGQNRWTTVTGEGGSFEENIEAMPVERYVAGWSIQQGERVPDPTAVSTAQSRVLVMLTGDDSVVAARVMPTKGLYGGVVEESFDTEWTVEKGKHDPSMAMAEIAKLAQENEQYDIFVSRVVAPNEDNANARPGVEIYFRNAKALNAAMPVLEKFTARGQDGFTMAVDPRAKVEDSYIGVRLQYVPEISARWDEDARKEMLAEGGLEKLLQEKFELLNDIAAEVSTMEGVAFASAQRYDTVVVGKENYDEYIDRAAAGRNRSGRGEVWFGQPVRQAVERAVARYEGKREQVSEGRVPAAGGELRPAFSARQTEGRGAEAAREIQEVAPPELESLFKGLNSRGLKRTRAEAAVNARPDAAMIRYVQDNFLDILSELEDSGKVKINCD